MTCSRPLEPAHSSGTGTVGSQKAPRPNSSTVGISAVQFAEDSESPRVPRKAKNDCACSVSKATASPPTWKFTRVSELEGVYPPQGEVASLSRLVPSGGGIVTVKWADVIGAKTRLPIEKSFNKSIEQYVMEGLDMRSEILFRKVSLGKSRCLGSTFNYDTMAGEGTDNSLDIQDRGSGAGMANCVLSWTLFAHIYQESCRQKEAMDTCEEGPRLHRTGLRDEKTSFLGI